MNAMTHANATAQTDFGWRRMLAGASAPLVVVWAATRPHLVPPLAAALVPFVRAAPPRTAGRLDRLA